ncbi:MAG: M28 family peptidase [Muribaculaceae bacterium]|nr:M28 family peptidase [Muribaculaceae bacterium]
MKLYRRIVVAVLSALSLAGCAATGGKAAADSTAVEPETVPPPVFEADSAYAYLKRQVDFGPRVPNTDAHRLTGQWLASELTRHGAVVTEQKATLTAFDGTQLMATNIMGRFNPSADDRVLLLAHWDCRPWADEDPDSKRHNDAVDGANDGASGVAVLLEIARLIKESGSSRGIDILFLDAEDWGTTNDDDSWALGAQYFMAHLPDVGKYRPSDAILLDMVGGKNATFCREYFSQKSAPGIADAVWATARAAGYGDYFPNRMGGAVTDDHVKLIEGGIPAIDIIDYRPGDGFNPTWHTVSDNLDNIDPATLQAVGQPLTNYLLAT